MSEEFKQEERVASISPDGLSVQMNDPKEQTPEQEPRIIPEKQEVKKFAGQFDSVEELEAKFKELSAKAQEAESEKKTEEEPKEDNTPAKVPETREDAEKALETSNLNIADFESEYAQNGALSDESYAKLEKAGFKKEAVDRYIQASNIVSDNMIASIKGAVGGDEQYAKMSSWAQENLPPSDIEGYNAIMNSGNVNLIRMAVQNLNYKYTEANGRRPAVQVSGRANASTSQAHDGFRSSAEMVEAMRDPRYGKDPAYTRDTERRVALAQF